MKPARSARAIDDGTRINSARWTYFPLALPFVRRVGRAITKSRPLARHALLNVVIPLEAFQETTDEDSFHEPARNLFAVSDAERAENQQALHALRHLFFTSQFAQFIRPF